LTVLDKSKKITERQESWEKKTVPNWLKRHPERRREFFNLSEVPIKRLYTPEDTQELDYVRDVGFPGEFPFTRGVHATMYRGRLWTMRQFSGFATAEQTNK
jgi:methylmalonyl-CoA mutase N-terminal domain/subunit